jgi:hypothetical protein
MNAFSSKSLSDNPKPVLSRVEGSAILNRKWLELWVFILVLLLTGAVVQAQQPGKDPSHWVPGFKYCFR